MKKTTTKRKANKKKQLQSKKILLILLVAIGSVLLLGLFMSRQQQASLLTNENSTVCVANTAELVLTCENLETGATANISIPKKYQGSIISPSPDGTKLLVMDTVYGASGRIVVTDLGFTEVQTVIKGFGSNNESTEYSWSSDSKNIIIYEKKREQGDANFLPVPIVVSMYDLSSGETRRVYKTGEKNELELDRISIVGANDRYLFLSLPTTKNWVAKETFEPPHTLQAIRLSDGLVLPINSRQINSDEVMYDGINDQFISTKNPSENEQVVYIAKLVDSDYGLTLEVTDKLRNKGRFIDSPEVMTTKGVWATSDDSTYNYFQLMNGQGEMTTVQLKREKYDTLLSLREMPTSQE